MIKFFRHIRRSLLSEGKTRRYLKYAIGEIVLVVIGILIALQINNWNERQKDIRKEKEVFKNLLTSLRKDSVEVNRILDLQLKSTEEQEVFIKTSFETIRNQSDADEFSNRQFNIFLGTFSFFPKYGTYNSIISNDGIDIIRSELIKERLVEYYDYLCKRYENIDGQLDQVMVFDFIPFQQEVLGFFVDSKLEYDPVALSNNEVEYRELVNNCMKVNVIQNQSIILLTRIQKSINELLMLIYEQLRPSDD